MQSSVVIGGVAVTGGRPEDVLEVDLELSPARRRELRVRFLGSIAYERALAMQEALVAEKISGDDGDDLLLLEHEAVYTLGRAANAADLLDAPAETGAAVFRIGRGGGVTFHGPGQLVGYPIVHLRPSRDVHRYIRLLERSLIETCAGFGVDAGVRQGETGVWVGDEKIASIGIGVRRGIALHGVALNVSTDLSYFDRIVPCRTVGMRMTSLLRQCGAAPPLESVAVRFGRCFAACLESQDTHGGGVS